jgi:hypothetical protein
VWLQLCINSALGSLQTKQLTNGNQWKEGHAVTETRVFYRISMFFPDRRRECHVTTHAVKVSLILFSKGQYVTFVHSC